MQTTFRYSLTTDHSKKPFEIRPTINHIMKKPICRNIEMYNLRTITLNYMSFVSITIGIVAFFVVTLSMSIKDIENGFCDRTL